MRQFPKKAMAATLNKLAYEGKQTAPEHIKSAMTLRGAAFISRTIGYTKTRSNLESAWGMRPRTRFTGLSEQEFGRTDTKRAPTLESRGGKLSSKIKPKYRLKRSMKVASFKDFKRQPVNENQAIAIWRKVGYKGLVRLGRMQLASARSGAMIEQEGIYRLVGGSRFKKVKLVHALGDIPQQKKRPWMKPTNESLKKDFKKHWASAVKSAIQNSLRGNK